MKMKSWDLTTIIAEQSPKRRQCSFKERALLLELRQPSKPSSIRHATMNTVDLGHFPGSSFPEL